MEAEALKMFFDTLGVGANGLVLVIIYFQWKLDRRLLRIEMHLFNGKKK